MVGGRATDDGLIVAGGRRMTVYGGRSMELLVDVGCGPVVTRLGPAVTQVLLAVRCRGSCDL